GLHRQERELGMSPSSSSRRRMRGAIYLVGAVVAAFGLWAGARWPTSGASRVQETYSQDRGYFYRFRARFEGKDTGARIDFDYVSPCTLRLIRWRDGGLSDDSTYGPRMMVKATVGGQAVMLRTLGACHGLTSENGAMPPGVLPMAIWFDSVEDL